MDALKELSLVIIMFGGPVLFVILWGQHKERQARKNKEFIVDLTEFKKKIEEAHMPIMSFGFKLDEVGRAMKKFREAQARKDDQIFKTVEEHNNELD